MHNERVEKKLWADLKLDCGEMVNLLDEKWGAQLCSKSKSDQSLTFIWHITAVGARDRRTHTSKDEGKKLKEEKKS